jgi:hypothetical protein
MKQRLEQQQKIQVSRKQANGKREQIQISRKQANGKREPHMEHLNDALVIPAFHGTIFEKKYNSTQRKG